MDKPVPNILVTGAKDKAQALEGLAVRVFVTDTGRQAIRCLRNKKIDTVVSKWELIDLTHGQFLKKVITAKPGIPTIALIKAGDYKQEIAARSIGVSAVLPEDIDDEHFRKTVKNLKGSYDIINKLPLADNWLPLFIEEFLTKYITGRLDLAIYNLGINSNKELRYYDPVYDAMEEIRY